MHSDDDDIEKLTFSYIAGRNAKCQNTYKVELANI